MRSVVNCRYWGLFFVFLFLASTLISCNKEVPVPDVRGMSESAAAAAIQDAGLAVGTPGEEYSNTVPVGQVIRQNPAAGASVAPDTVVTFVLSMGPQPVDVPDVVGMTEEAAQTALEDAGLALGTPDYPYSDTIPAGEVISQDPVAGTSVAPGTAVALTVSAGPEPVPVPDVVNMTQSAAQSAIEAAGLNATITLDYSDTVPNGIVISQNPPAGTSVAPGSAVSFEVSKGPEPVDVPDVVGMTEADAQAAIENAGLIVGNVDHAYSDTVPDGQVSSQDPASDRTALPGTPVKLVVSDGPEPVNVPNVVGMTESEAQTAIDAVGVTVGTVDYAFSDTVAKDHVISQNPVADTSVLPGTAVALVVSKGPDLVTVPDVVGMTESAAQTALTAERLQASVTRVYSDTVPEGEVISQDPAAGASVAPNTAVTLFVSKGPEPEVTVPNVVGMTQSDAENAIKNAGLKVGTVAEEYSDTLPVHEVMSQDPAAGASVKAGSAVALGVSKGLPMADGETDFAPTREIETVELEEGVEIEAAAREVLLSVKRDITAEQMLELMAWLESQGFVVAGHSAQASMLQIQTPLKSLKLNKSLFDSFEEHAYIVSAGPNMVCDLDSLEVLYEDPAQIGIVRDNEAGYLYGQSIEMPAIPKALLWKADPPAVVWNPSGFGGDWWIDAVNAPEAWELSTGNPDVIIGIADAGCDPIGTIEADRLTLMYGDGSSGSDIHSHGTFVTGLAAGDGDPAGTEDTVGMAWKNSVVFVTYETPLIPIPFLGRILMKTDLVAGINTAIDNGARVVNLSAGHGALSSNTVGTEQKFLAARQQWRERITGSVYHARQEDVLVCFSAGNDGFGMDKNHHPPN